MDLIILAAGMGSRFGGLKQIQPVDDDGHFIIDYSVYDAVKAGFRRVVFVIRKGNYKDFRDTIGKRFEGKIDVEYVFQENDSIPADFIPKDRAKPLGTAHAILCCKDVVKDPFMIVNADDFYGFGSYELAIGFDCTDSMFGCVTYKAGNTLTENGKVKRGMCIVKDGNVTGLIESSIYGKDGMIMATPLDGSDEFTTGSDAPVSMNMFILPPSVFSTFSKEFDVFVKNMNDPEKDEFLLPDVINKIIGSGDAILRNIVSDEHWYGITYREDLDGLKSALKDMNSKGKYNWN